MQLQLTSHVSLHFSKNLIAVQLAVLLVDEERRLGTTLPGWQLVVALAICFAC